MALNEDINLGAITEALNDKADLDFNNTDATGKNNTVYWGVPDYSQGISIGLRLSNNKYTAPSTGIIVVDNMGQNQSGTYSYFVVNGVTTNLGVDSASAYTTGGTHTFAVAKGDICYFSTSIPVNSVYFYPLKGAS